jgi:ABC-2 type transport system permease protein
MRKKIFDKKLYIEGIMQLRLIGIILFVLFFVGSALLPLGYWINQLNNVYEYVMVISIIETTPLLMAFIFIAPIIMCITLFSFLNKRNGSDFYHSVPNTRTSIYISYAASILTWVFATIIASVLISSLFFSSLGFIFNLSYIPYLIFTYLACAVLITGTMLVAMSITGTALTNITVMMLILFLPRLITTVFYYTLNNAIRIADVSAFGILFNVNYDIPVKLILKFTGQSQTIGLMNDDSLFTFIGGILYTFILGIIYLCLAGFLFKIRKSEAAGKSAPNNILQHIYRIAITLPITLIIPSSIVLAVNMGSWLHGNIVMLITIALISLFIYFMFELITTRNAKNMLKAAPIFLVIIALDIAFGFSVNSMKSSVLNVKPTVNDISSISFHNYLKPSANNNNSQKTYMELTVDKSEYKDPIISNMIAKALSTEIDNVKNGKFMDYQIYATHFNATIKLKNGKTIQRYIFMPLEDYDSISNLITKQNINNKYLYKLPPDDAIKIFVIGTLNKEDSKKVWSSFKEEYSALSLDDVYKYVGDGNLSYFQSNQVELQSEIYQLKNISITGNIGVNNFSSIYIISSKTPKTMQLVADLTNKSNKKSPDVLMNKIINKEKINYGYDIRIVNFKTSDDKLIDISTNNSFIFDNPNYKQDAQKFENDKKLFQIVKKQLNKKADTTKPFLSISMYELTTIQNGGYYTSSQNTNNYYIPLDDQDIKDLSDIFKKEIETIKQ